MFSIFWLFHYSMNVLIKSSENKNIKNWKQKQIVIFEKKTVFVTTPALSYDMLSTYVH